MFKKGVGLAIFFFFFNSFTKEKKDKRGELGVHKAAFI